LLSLCRMEIEYIKHNLLFQSCQRTNVSNIFDWVAWTLWESLNLEFGRLGMASLWDVPPYPLGIAPVFFRIFDTHAFPQIRSPRTTTAIYSTLGNQLWRGRVPFKKISARCLSLTFH
jgi:hypothetical protein